MSTIPYFLRNPNLDDQAQQPMTMAPAAAPQGMAAPVVQHPMHAMIAPIVGAPPKLSRAALTAAPDDPGTEPAAMSQSDIEGMGASTPPTMAAAKQPTVRTMTPIERREDELTQGMAKKPQGFWGKFGHYAGMAGRIAGDIVAPGQTEMIVHDLGKEGIGPRANEFRNEEMRGLEKEQSEQALQGAQTAEAQAMPELHKAQSDLAQEKQDEAENNHQAQIDQHLRTTGFMRDGNGDIVPDEKSPVYQKQQIANQLAQSTVELRKAQTDFEQMKGDPKSPLNQQIAQRLNIAKQAQDRMTGMMGAMQERADAQMMSAKAGTMGVDMNNNPLPGAMLTDQGETVGSHFQSNVRPTGAQRGKGNMAESADQQINDMKGIVAKRSDIFGPAAGRTTDFTVWLGSQDPDAQRFRAARTIAGDHLAGTFGGRSETALRELDSAIGHFKDNPKAVAAGLDQLQEANHLFLNAGKVHTVGGNQPTPGGGAKPPDPNPNNAKPGYHRIYVEGNGWGSVPNG